MKSILFCTTLLAMLPLTALAYEPMLIEPADQFEIIELETGAQERWLVGELTGFPHTFQFVTGETMPLSVQVMVEDAADTETVSLIMIKEEARGVSEVMRRTASDETWEAVVDARSKLRFRESGSFSEELAPGIYRLEVSNLSNDGQYVLKTGSVDDDGYFTTVKHIAALRSYLGYSKIGMVTNPYIFMPLFVVFSLLFFGWYARRRV